jgi:hypothetical protein
VPSPKSCKNNNNNDNNNNNSGEESLKDWGWGGKRVGEKKSQRKLVFLQRNVRHVNKITK